jgi:MFS family permease
VTGPAVDARTWRRAAFGLFAVAAGTNVPTPLLLIYRDTLDLGPDVLTAVFGCYALGLVPALALAGPLSDRFGRRRVMLPCMVLAALTSLLLIAASSSLPVLFAGRALQGAVSGAVFTVGSAWVAELSLFGGTGAAGRRAAVAMTGGFSIGPFVSGLLGEYAPRPTTLPYLLHVLLVVVGLLAALRVPETVALVASQDRAVRGPAGRARRPPGAADRPRAARLCVLRLPTVVVSAVPLLVETTPAGAAHRLCSPA